MYGICNISIVPVRTEASDKSELCTQLLFGDLYLIIEEQEKWLKIKTAYDGYEGWIDRIQHFYVTKQYFNDYLTESHPILNKFSTLATIGNNFFPILLGSVLPFYKEGKIWIGDIAIKIEYSPENNRSLIDTAFLYYNAPYLWGGKTPYGIDCSGFVQQVFKMCGKKMLRDASEQVASGEEVSLDASIPGDVAFFSNDKGKVVHVGIVLPNEKIIHAHGKVRVDKLDQVGIFNNDRNEYSHNLASIKRIM